MAYNQTLRTLSELDLTMYPKDEVQRLLGLLGNVGLVITTLGPGKKIIRARINDSFSERFGNISEVSYPPNPSSNYGRASSPGNTMFYGAIVPEIRGREESDTARSTALYEASTFAKDRSSKGVEKVTFSVWEVVEEIDLISLIHFEHFERPPKMATELQKQYARVIAKFPELKLKSDTCNKFISEQFAKAEIRGDYDYIISAIFTEMVCSRGAHGVLYPSVPLRGHGINIAIQPTIVDSNIAFRGSMECTLYKNENNALMDNEKEAQISGSGDLIYKNIKAEQKLSVRKARQHVGLSYWEYLRSRYF